MSRQLFQTDFGEPLCEFHTGFYLSSNSPLKALIEQYGGKVVPINAYHYLHLIPNAPNTITKEVYKSPVYAETYVHACIEQGKILPLCDFQVFAGRESRHRRAKLGQMEINELVRFVREHPEKEHGAGYWDWVSANLPFVCQAKLLQKCFNKHINALRRQGFIRDKKAILRPAVQVEIVEYHVTAKVVEPPCLDINAGDPVWVPEVLSLFSQLVDQCQAQTRAKVTKPEVLRALLRNQGHSQKTIQSFLL